MQPWMSKIEIETILKYIKADGVMLEYGCGGSTLYFCDYVKEYYSVEHNADWYNKMNRLAKPNTKIFYVPRNETTPDKERFQPLSWDELESSSRYKDFQEYIKFPSTLDKKFDFVLIDGRARPECAKLIYNYLHEDSVVFIHDYWNRKHYHVVEEKYKVIDAVKSGQSLVVLKKQ